MQVDWELSQQLESDSQGIRVASVLQRKDIGSDDVDAFSVLAGNQGGGLCAFGIPSGSLHPVDYQHNHAVTALLTMDHNDNDSCSFYATGCKDSQIRIFSVDKNHAHKLVATLEGHEKPVTSLASASTSEGHQYLLSGSWDGTAKVWDLSRKVVVATLSGHENSVCVVGLNVKNYNLPIGTLQIATGSAGIAQNNEISGHTVRLWNVNVKTGESKCLHQVANDHDGPIRNIALLPSLDSKTDLLATCSNDGTVKLRSCETGGCVSTLMFMQQQQHPPMLLSVTPFADGTFLAASAEDGHVVVWNLHGGGEPQIILHPACVWSLTALPNGDLATCCQDGKLRIFTHASDRVAPLAERDQFAQAVQEAHQKQSSGPTPEEIAKLPLWELSFRQHGSSEGQVQCFNKGGVAIAAQWSMASQTWIEVGQVMGSSDGGTVDGVRYDHVLPIEVDQTGGGVAKLQIGYSNGENPFVAAQRFIDSYMLPQYHLNDIADYIQKRVGSEGTTLGGGPGAPPPVATTGLPMIAYKYLPIPGYKQFELPAKSASTTLGKMKSKLQDFGKLSDAQLGQVSSLMDILVGTNRYHVSKVSSSELAVVSDMLDKFPPNEAFPALDLARMVVLHPDAASANNAAYWNKVLSQVVSLSGQTEGLDGPSAVAIPMLSLRLFANAFRGGIGSLEAARCHLEDMFRCIHQFHTSNNKNVRLSVATLLYNISCFIHSSNTSQPEIAARVVTEVDRILKLNSYEGEAVSRLLIALGTVAMASPEAKETAKHIYVVSRVEMAASPHGDVARAVAKEVYQVLQ